MLWSYVFLTSSCQVCWRSYLLFLPFRTVGSRPLLRSYALVTGCFIRIDGIPHHTWTITGPGTWWFVADCITIHTRTSSRFFTKHFRSAAMLTVFAVSAVVHRYSWLFAWAFSIQCPWCSSCSCEWLSTSLSVTVRKGQFGMSWCGLPYSWAAESSFAFILKSGMQGSTALCKIPHFWIIPSHVSWTCLYVF